MPNSVFRMVTRAVSAYLDLYSESGQSATFCTAIRLFSYSAQPKLNRRQLGKPGCIPFCSESCHGGAIEKWEQMWLFLLGSGVYHVKTTR